MTIRLSIGRFEGDKKRIAVLLTDDGTAINFPEALLPKGARARGILTIQIERDANATWKLAADTRKVQDQLKKTDPGQGTAAWLSCKGQAEFANRERCPTAAA